MVKLFRLIEMCQTKPCGELCADLHLADDAFAVYNCLSVTESSFFNLRMVVDSLVLYPLNQWPFDKMQEFQLLYYYAC